MERTIIIDGKEVRLRASAAIPRLYRIKFHRDILADMRNLAKAISRETGEGGSHIPPEALELFENISYIMARHADPQGVPGSPEEWLEGFETFSVYQVFPVIQQMWADNLRTMVASVKK